MSLISGDWHKAHGGRVGYADDLVLWGVGSDDLISEKSEERYVMIEVHSERYTSTTFGYNTKYAEYVKYVWIYNIMCNSLIGGIYV